MGKQVKIKGKGREVYPNTAQYLASARVACHYSFLIGNKGTHILCLDQDSYPSASRPTNVKCLLNKKDCLNKQAKEIALFIRHNLVFYLLAQDALYISI